MDYTESNVECKSVNLVFARSVSKSKRTNQVEKNGEIWFKQRAAPREPLCALSRESIPRHPGPFQLDAKFTRRPTRFQKT